MTKMILLNALDSTIMLYIFIKLQYYDAFFTYN